MNLLNYRPKNFDILYRPIIKIDNNLTLPKKFSISDRLDNIRINNFIKSETLQRIIPLVDENEVLRAQTYGPRVDIQPETLIERFRNMSFNMPIFDNNGDLLRNPDNSLVLKRMGFMEMLNNPKSLLFRTHQLLNKLNQVSNTNLKNIILTELKLIMAHLFRKSDKFDFKEEESDAFSEILNNEEMKRDLPVQTDIIIDLNQFMNNLNSDLSLAILRLAFNTVKDKYPDLLIRMEKFRNSFLNFIMLRSDIYKERYNLDKIIKDYTDPQIMKKNNIIGDDPISGYYKPIEATSLTFGEIESEIPEALGSEDEQKQISETPKPLDFKDIFINGGFSVESDNYIDMSWYNNNVKVQSDFLKTLEKFLHPDIQRLNLGRESFLYRKNLVKGQSVLNNIKSGKKRIHMLSRDNFIYETV
jgi:hypothetical protein